MPHEQKRQKGMVCFDLTVVIAWLIDREKRRQHPKSGDLGLEAERIRLIRAQADLEELDNAIKRGELLYAADSSQAFSELGALLASRLEHVAGRLANEVVNEPNPAVIREKSLQEHRAIRESFADSMEQLAQHYASLADSSEDSLPTAHEDSGLVGRF